jgi:broad specificity phosphatase PhoE
MKQPTHITLVRHGETIWNRELRLQGSKDIPLSDLGLAQAEAVAKRLQPETFHRVYSSHLNRAHKTADTLAQTLQLPHHVHEHLRERSYGEIEGWTREEILAKYPDFWGPGNSYDVPGLETFEQLSERVHQTINELANQHEGERLLLVSHGGTINAFLHAISGGQFGSGVNKLGNTSVTQVVREADGKWTIETVGCTEHLDEDSK